VAGKNHVLLLLPQDLVADGSGNSVGPEPADGEVFAVMDEFRDGFFHRHNFADQGSVLMAEKFPRLVGIGVHKKRALTLCDNIKHGRPSFFHEFQVSRWG
jgi:hypothetical protein